MSTKSRKSPKPRRRHPLQAALSRVWLERRPCALCGAAPTIVGVFVPTDPQAWGFPVGSSAGCAYALCAVHQPRPGAETWNRDIAAQVERVLWVARQHVLAAQWHERGALMADFTLEPDEPNLDRPERTRPVRRVGTDLHPTAAVPTQTKGPSYAAVYTPCACGALTITGETDEGRLLRLTPAIPTWCMLWVPGQARPRLAPSRGYPEHHCVVQKGER